MVSFLAILLIAGLTVGGFVLKFILTAPTLNPHKLVPVQTSYVYDDKDELYATFHGEEDRTVVPYQDMPKNLINAFIAIEDERFWSHIGIDFESIGRAVFKRLTGGRIEGASTITQQLLKLSILTPARNWERKIQEQWLAIKLERLYTKEEILQMYLNRAFMGHYAHGVEAGSNMYFGKTVKDLSLAECAMLAGLNQRPNYFSPFNNLEKSINRRNLVLSQMAKQGLITEAEASEAKEEKVILNGSTRKSPQKYPQYTWYMKEVAKNVLIENGYCSNSVEADKLIFSGGIHIYTTLNQEMQKAVEETVTEIMENLGEEEADGTMGPQIAAMIIDPQTGHVKAAVGDRDITQNGLKRYAQSYVPTGSSVKPVIDYAIAIEEKGYTAGTIIDDAPVSYKGWGRGEYRPLNFFRNFQGLLPMRTAIVKSLNIPAMKTFMDIGIEPCIEFAHKLGINSTIQPYPSSALGGSELNLEEMVRAFGVFANEGLLVSSKDSSDKWQNIYITKITDSNGNTIYEPKTVKSNIMKKESAYIMTNILEGVTSYYTNARTIGDYPAAGKTGTSQGSQYTWFVGYTPEYAGGVWIGHDSYNYSPGSGDNKGNIPLSKRKWQERGAGLTGSRYPAKVWGTMMNKALTAIGAPKTKFDVPDNIIGPIPISSKTGLLPGPNTPTQFIYNEIFIKGTEPTEVEDFFKTVRICKDTSQLAGPNCPAESVVLRQRFVRETDYDRYDIKGNPLQLPKDSVWELPKHTCTLHTGVTPPVDPNNPTDPNNPDNPTDPSNPTDPTDPNDPNDGDNPNPNNPPADGGN
ncbi:PBP1A family penicillin-binding protein [Clostridium sp. 'deep sea']|uniref:transglycosylase domain-containing protein n=1 Tax=Clostridium sp. 'deep sea' TaxID=2779445 RepID=UPI0018967070|nr:PBP1A family penicillin-binding protein [Clostridium sp. 'deep sea']QOR35638.1 PBP1A family penicillin-binding protein [Clostridium sp. 'deep sea']